MNVCRNWFERFRVASFVTLRGSLVLLAGVATFSVANASAEPTTKSAVPTIALVAADDDVDLPVHFGELFWSVRLEWKFPPCVVIRTLHDGLGEPLPFFFIGDQIVIARDSFIFERNLKDGRPRRNRALKLPLAPQTIARMPEAHGWAWAQRSTEEGPASIFLSRERPSETNENAITTLIGRYNSPGLGDVLLTRSRAKGVLPWRLDFCPDGSRLLALNGFSSLYWSVEKSSQSQLAEFDGTGVSPNYCIRDRVFAFAPNGSSVAHASVGHFGFSLKLSDARTAKELFVWQRKKNYGVQSVRYSPDSSKLFLLPYSTVADQPAFIEFDIATRTEKGYETKDAVRDGVFNNDEKHPMLVTRNQGSSVGFWNWKERKQKLSLDLKSGEVRDLAVSPDGKIVAVATDEEIHFLEIATQKQVGDRDYVHPKVVRVRFAEDNRHFASLGADGELRIWRLDFMGNPPAKVAPQYDGASF
jgi:hypothetical protein